MYQPEIFDFSYRDINVPAKAFFQQFSSSIPEGSTAMYSSSCQCLCFPHNSFALCLKLFLSVPLNIIVGRKYSGSDSTVWM